MIIIGFAGLSSIATSLVSSSSLQSSWLIVNQLQLTILLPLTRAFMDKEVMYYWAGMEFAQFSFSFTNLDDTKGISLVDDYFNIPQSEWYLQEIKLETGSTAVNILPTLTILLLLPLAHLIWVLFFYLWIKNWNIERWNKLSARFLKYYFVSTYIRLLLESSQLMVLSSASELERFDTGSSKESISVSVAAWIYLFQFLLIILLGYCIFTTKIVNLEFRTNYFTEIFTGVKPTKYAKW